MAPFTIPRDSLSRLYREAYSEFTWEKVWTTRGVKVKSKIRKQTGPTCIYEAVASWMESHLRLLGIIVFLSAKDLEEKEQALNSDEVDRTVRCIIVIKTVGVCSEDDYITKNKFKKTYFVEECHAFYKLNEEAITSALDSMHKGPLLVVFHCGGNFMEYVFKFKEKPVLSYERYREDIMDKHAVNSLGYGIENFVPWWRYMNSYGKSYMSKGVGRVLPQNCTYVYGLDKVYVREYHKRRVDDDDENGQPPIKKRKLDNVDLMDVDVF